MDRLGLTEKGKEEKHQSILKKKQGPLNIVIYCVYGCMGHGLKLFLKTTALNLNPWYNNVLSKTSLKACFHTLPKDKNPMVISKKRNYLSSSI